MMLGEDHGHVVIDRVDGFKSWLGDPLDPGGGIVDQYPGGLYPDEGHRVLAGTGIGYGLAVVGDVILAREPDPVVCDPDDGRVAVEDGVIQFGRQDVLAGPEDPSNHHHRGTRT